MVWTILNRLGKPCLICFVSILCLASCSVSYKFNGASIDYTKVKSIQIADFPIRATYVWGPMAPMFNNRLKDIFANHTRLEQVKRNGDMKIEGEITQYQQRNKSVSSEGYSAQTELSMTVNVRFTNNTNHNDDGNSVTDTFIRNFFTQPQHKHRTGGQNNDRRNCKESSFDHKCPFWNLCM